MANEYGGSGGPGGSGVLRADPALTATTASRMLDIQLAGDERWRAALSEMEATDPAYGDLTGSPALADAHRRALADAAAALQALGEAVQADVDRLLQVAFGIREADLAAQHRSVDARRTGPGR